MSLTATTLTDSELFLVDSSGWIEYLGEGPKAEAFAPYLEREEATILPTIVVYEVFKKLYRERGAISADHFLSYAFRTRIVNLDVSLALESARTGLQLRLRMADSIIYATAKACGAQLITCDTDFNALPGVTVL
jgi:predicted nucleic acid-binding protein